MIVVCARYGEVKAKCGERVRGVRDAEGKVESRGENAEQSQAVRTAKAGDGITTLLPEEAARGSHLPVLVDNS